MNQAQQIKRLLLKFFRDNKVERQKLEITSIEVIEHPVEIDIKIILCKPSYIIGIKGSMVSKLAGFLSNSLDKKVNVIAIQSDLWEG